MLEELYIDILEDEDSGNCLFYPLYKLEGDDNWYYFPDEEELPLVFQVYDHAWEMLDEVSYMELAEEANTWHEGNC